MRTGVLVSTERVWTEGVHALLALRESVVRKLGGQLTGSH
jgi:hypothetical protein